MQQLRDHPGVDLDTPPPYPVFAKGHASKNAGVQNPPTPAPPSYNIILPSNYYPSNALPHHSIQHQPLDSLPVPSLYDFLSNLDEEEGVAGVFTAFESVFQKESIKVTHIKNLTDSQFVQLGVVRIGWQIALKQASEKYI